MHDRAEGSDGRGGRLRGKQRAGGDAQVYCRCMAWVGLEMALSCVEGRTLQRDARLSVPSPSVLSAHTLLHHTHNRCQARTYISESCLYRSNAVDRPGYPIQTIAITDTTPAPARTGAIRRDSALRFPLPRCTVHTQHAMHTDYTRPVAI